MTWHTNGRVLWPEQGHETLITDLIQVGAIYQIIVSKWNDKRIKLVGLWEQRGKHERKTLNTIQEVNLFYKILLESWKTGDLRAMIVEEVKDVATVGLA